MAWKVIEALGLSWWSVLETASWGTEEPRNVKIHATDIVRLSYVTTAAAETFVRSLYFTIVAAETLVYIKGKLQSTNKHSRPVYLHMDQPGSTG